MANITKREAIRASKRIWRLVLTGDVKDKRGAIRRLRLRDVYRFDCPLCHYARPDEGYDCSECPLVEQTGGGCLGNRSICIPHGLFDHIREPQEFASLIMALKE